MGIINDGNVEEIRKDFSFFRNNPDLAYLDNSATSQRPDVVVDRAAEFYKTVNSNPMRGLYEISVEATRQYEEARSKTAEFIGAARPEEIIFTRNATESLNLVAFSLCEKYLKKDDEIVISIMEHHSNMLPWRHAAKRIGANVCYLYPDKDGLVSEECFRNAISDKTKIVAMTQVSNVFGRVNDIKTFATIAHEKGAFFIADGAQSVPHMKVDVKDLDVDFMAFSGHKMLAPMGIGALYGKYEILNEIPPFLTGGEMIDTVRTDTVKYAKVPHKFEAGTVNAGGAVALAQAIDYINGIGMENIEAREAELGVYLYDKIKDIPGVTVFGSKNPREHHGIFTFKLEGVHPHDIAEMFSSDQVAVRAGHHCAQPLMDFIETPSTTRASIAFYNTKAEIDRFAEDLGQIRGLMGFVD